MNHLKCFEKYNTKIEQQPFFLSGSVLYVSDDIAKSITPDMNFLLKKYKSNEIALRFKQDIDDFFNDTKIDNHNSYKVSSINTNYTVRYGGNYSMSIRIKRRGASYISNEHGNFKYYIGGNSGDFDMHGKNMKRATIECNLNLIIKMYPIVEHIKDFYKKLKNKENNFLDIIKNELDKNIYIAKYGIPKELKKYYSIDIENAINNMDKYNL